MFFDHIKVFPFFFFTEKKGRKKNNSLSHTHKKNKIFCNRYLFAPELLNMNFLLALCLLRAPRFDLVAP